MGATSTEVDLWTQAHAQLTPEARLRFTVNELRTIKRTVMPDLDPAEFQMTIAMAARYDLDPLAKEIWGVKGKTRNGQPGRVLIMVGRDGLLKVARRDPTYAGSDTDVVRANDVFKVKRSSAGREIIHEYEGSDVDRGAIVGAWAQVYQKGYHDTYFYAPFSEYMPKNADPYSPWTKQPSVMIQKCALALCLRLAFNLSGVVAEEEAARVFEGPAEAAQDSEGAFQSVADGLQDDELRERFWVVVRGAAEFRPGMLTAAGVQMSLSGVTSAEVLTWLEEQEALNTEARDAAAPVEDAVVVPTEEEMAVWQRRLSDLYDVQQDSGSDEVDEEIERLEEMIQNAGGSLPGGV